MERFRISKGKSQLIVTKRKSNGQHIVDSDTSFLKCWLDKTALDLLRKASLHVAVSSRPVYLREENSWKVHLLSSEGMISEPIIYWPRTRKAKNKRWFVNLLREIMFLWRFVSLHGHQARCLDDLFVDHHDLSNLKGAHELFFILVKFAAFEVYEELEASEI